MAEQTPGYAAALGAAQMEGDTAYIHQLAEELLDSFAAQPPARQAGIRGAATRHGLTLAQYLAYRSAGLKWCRACQDWRPLTDYKPSTSTKDGVRPLCARHYTPKPITHDYNGYQRGCRCTECRDGNRQYQARIRANRRQDPTRADRAGHGKRTTYNNYGCRCPACREAQAQYMKVHNARRRAREKTTT